MIRSTLALALIASNVAMADNIAIINAKAVTQSAQGTLENATILIRGDEITAIGSAVNIPEGTVVIDAAGQYVTPGFVGTAVNWGSVEVSAESSTVDAYSDESGAATSMQYAINPDSTRLPLAYRFGFTRAIVAPGGGNKVFMGQAAAIKTFGDDLVTAADIAQFVDVEEFGKDVSGGTRAALWVNLERVITDAKHYANNPRDRYSNSGSYVLSLDSLEALQAVISGDVPLVFDANRMSDLRLVMDFAERHNLKAVIRGGAEAWRVADELAAADIPVLVDPYLNLPYGFDQRAARLDNAALLNAAGVTIAFYNGEPYTGQTLTQAAGLAVAHGLPWESAVDALTVNAVDIFGGAYSATLEVGQTADVVVWSGDPLELTSAPTTVVIDGEQVELKTREEALAKRYFDIEQTEPFSYN
ncbi:imidazolonepropionase [uncultured Umboniibacter sp.]|uniref:imidazolonepropionase n=1 Tax=uncultured Umboniibacter sp. TaxID=1798917 RepID=UPI002631FABB|nr:imidazolonepropionase [uncultured Umboniibacter sp.]